MEYYSMFLEFRGERGGQDRSGGGGFWGECRGG